MKKFLLAGALLIGAMVPVSAKELVFQTKDGKSFPNGYTLEFGEVEIDDEIPGIFYIEINPELYLLSDETATVTVTCTSISGPAVQLCAGGDCITTDQQNPIVKNDVSLTAGIPLDLLFDYYGEVEGSTFEIPDIVAVLEAWYNDDPTNKVTLNVHMGDFDAAVETIGLNSNFVFVTGSELNYNVANASQLTLYSLSGKTLLNTTVSGTGSISLASYAKGVYLYRLTGKEKKAGKFIIR